MMRFTGLFEAVTHFFVEILDPYAAGDYGFFEALFAHPLFGFGDYGTAQVLPPVFRQYDDAPDFRRFAVYAEPAASRTPPGPLSESPS